MHHKIHLGSAPHSGCTLGKEYCIMSHDSLKNVLNRKAKDDGNGVLITRKRERENITPAQGETNVKERKKEGDKHL